MKQGLWYMHILLTNTKFAKECTLLFEHTFFKSDMKILDQKPPNVASADVHIPLVFDRARFPGLSYRKYANPWDKVSTSGNLLGDLATSTQKGTDF